MCRSVGFWRPLALILGAVAVMLTVITGWLLVRLATDRRAVERAAEEMAPDRLDLRPASFGELPGWGGDRLSETLPVLASSCEVIRGLPESQPMGGQAMALTAAHWQSLCHRVASVVAPTDLQMQELLEAELVPWAVSNRGDPEALFTGYYEPTLAGSRHQDERFSIPLYLRPPELISVDLGDFRDDLKGRRIAGRVEARSLVPYFDREAIEDGALIGRVLELLWVDSAIDAFFLQVQGSGRVKLREGGYLRVGYSSQNGHPYTAIGRELVNRGELLLEEVSMQSIRHWLGEHPDDAAEVMQTNASYVFFRELEKDGPVGSQGVVLTPNRSLAVDRRFLPLGAPIWIDTTAPSAQTETPDRVLRRLFVAQDTGGAIRGPVRADIFWGAGRDAAEIAGKMRHEGRMWILLPTGTVDPGGSPR